MKMKDYFIPLVIVFAAFLVVFVVCVKSSVERDFYKERLIQFNHARYVITDPVTGESRFEVDKPSTK